MDEHGQVCVEESLAALQGRLDEGKRQRALAALSFTPALVDATADQGRAGPLFGAGRPHTAKAEREAIERDLKALQLGREAGGLVLVEEVDSAGRQAVAAMRDAFANARRDIAARMCVEFGVPAEKQTALTRFLGQEFERALGVFAREMQNAAGAAAAESRARAGVYDA